MALLDLYKVVARFKRNGQDDVINVYHVAQTYGVAAFTDEELMDAIMGWLDGMYTNFNSRIHNTLDAYDVKVDQVGFVGGIEQTIRTVGIRTWVLSQGPTGGGDALPPACAFLINMRTLRPKSTGRKYIGVPIEGDQTDGIASGAALTDLATFITNMLADIEPVVDVVFKAVVPSRWSTSGFYQILEATASAVIAYQRRRKTGRGA